MHKTLLTTLKTSTVLIGGALMAQAAMASGYHFGTQSVSSQATANSSAAEAADPSTLFYNPAGLTKLEGTQATVNVNLVMPSIKYSDAEAFYPITNEPVKGVTSGNIKPASVVVAPHLYASHQLNDQTAVGVGLYVPFGSGTDYQDNSVLRYNLNELGLQSIAIQPTVAYKFNNHSFAVGMVAQHTKAHLKQYANFGPPAKKGLQDQKAAAGAVGQMTDAELNGAIAGTQAALNNPATPPAQIPQLQNNLQGLLGMKAINARLAAMSNPNLPPPADLGNGAADAYAEVKGGDWGFGYNLAWLWDINDSARLGVNYRSKVKHTLKGDAEWHLVGDAFQDAALGSALGNAIRDRSNYKAEEDANVSITTPESLSIHGMYKLNPQWNVFADLTWTRHSRFNTAYLNFQHEKDVGSAIHGDSNPGKAGTQSDQTILTPKWRNTWKVALGASYQVSEPLQLRFGWAYDQSPVKNAGLRMSTLPDANRMWFSLGGKYDINKQHSINLAYSYLHIQKTRAHVNGWCGGENAAVQACVSSKTHGSAKFKSQAHILGLQYTYKF